MSEPSKPVYQLQALPSTSTYPTWEGIDQTCEKLKDGYAILWQYHAVFVGLIKGGKVNWLGDSQPEPEDKHLVRLRGFNQNQEFHFWRSGATIKGRLRNDQEGEPCQTVDTDMVLRGVIAQPLLDHKVLSGDTVSIKTRNYVGYHPDLPQAGYVDSRFISFVIHKNE